MNSRKWFTILSAATASAFILSACGGAPGTPIVQTVVVEKAVVQTKEVTVEKTVVVEKTIKETAAVLPTATPKPEWSTPHPILSDLKVRQAVATCSNRNELIGSVYSFLSEADRAKLNMDTFIPKDSVWYAKTANPNANIVQYTFDITKAGQLLDDAGWKLPKGASIRANDGGDPLALRFTTTNAAFRQTWGAVFVKQMGACGIQLLPSYIPGSIWFGSNSGLRRRDFDIGAFAWVGETEPPGVTLYACNQVPTPDNNWDGQNYMGWCNETADKAVKQANNTLVDADRKKLYATLQEEFSKDMISLPLFQRLEAAGANKNLKNFKPDPTEYFSANAADWELPGKETAVVALSQEPATMFSLIESSAVEAEVAQLVYGNFRTQYSYGFQPVTLDGDKFPTIENGGAVNSEVAVKDGDTIVNSNGDVGVFKGGKLLDSAGKELALKVKTMAGDDVDLKEGVKLPQLAVTFKFKPEKWSDGEPRVKADFELNFKVACSKDSGAVSYFGCERAAKVDFIDDNSYTVTYVPGYQPPTYYLPFLGDSSGTGGYYPSHQEIKTDGPYKGKKLADVAPKDFQTLPEVSETPLGTGPYSIVKWDKGQKITLKANPNYWKGEPKIKNIVVQIFQDNPAGAVAALLQGSVDVVGKETLGAGAELQKVIEEGAKGTISGIPMPSPTWEHADFNLFIR